MLRDISWGSRGPDVLAVQQGLNLRKQPRDPKVDEIGIFGPKTDTAVKRFQERNHLYPDGIVGPMTRAAIFPLAVVTVRVFGMRLRMPTFGAGSPSSSLGPLSLPPIGPSFGYQPVSFPRLSMPIMTPPLVPPTGPGIIMPFDHFELQPGASVSLGKRIDAAFTATLSAIVMIGKEKAQRHQELSSGIVFGSPGVSDGGPWTAGWLAQLTHVEQLGRSGNWSWQPNVGFVVGHGFLPVLSATASPAVIQFDANDNLSFSFGGPAATLSLGGQSLSWTIASAGIVFKFGKK